MIEKLVKIKDAELSDLQGQFNAIMDRFDVVIEIGQDSDGSLCVLCIDSSANVTTAKFTSRFIDSDLPSSVEAALKPVLYQLYEISGSTPEEGNV